MIGKQRRSEPGQWAKHTKCFVSVFVSAASAHHSWGQPLCQRQSLLTLCLSQQILARLCSRYYHRLGFRPKKSEQKLRRIQHRSCGSSVIICWDASRVIKKSPSDAVKGKQIILTANKSCSVVGRANWDGEGLNGGSIPLFSREFQIKSDHSRHSQDPCFRLNFHEVRKTPANTGCCTSTPKLSFGSQGYAEAAVAIGQHHCRNNLIFLFLFFQKKPKNLKQVKLKCHGRNLHRGSGTFCNFSINVSDWRTAWHQRVPIHIESQIRPGHLNAPAQYMQMHKLFKRYLRFSEHVTRQWNNSPRQTRGQTRWHTAPRLMSRISDTEETWQGVRRVNQ